MKKVKIVLLCIFFTIFITSLSSCLKDYDMSGVLFSSATVTYDGDSHSLAISGSVPEGVTVSYSYDGDNVTGETEAGTYEVVASFTGDTSEYKSISDMYATLTISKETISSSSVKLSNKSFVYDGEEHSLEVSGDVPDGVSASYTYDGESIDGETEVGEYAVIATLSGNDYETMTLDATLTITQAYGYEINSDGDNTITLTDYYGSETDITTPTIITDEGTTYTVTEIGDDCFEQNLFYSDDIESVTISSGVVSVGDDCFKYCKYLESLSLPETLEIIGEESFDDCYDLTEVTIPNSVTSIGEKCFCDCDSITSLTFEDSCSLTSLPTKCFDGCDLLTTVVIPDSIITIGDYAFSACNDLRTITLSSNLTTIGVKCFYSCTSLKTITIPSSVESIGSGCFYECSSLSSVIFEDPYNWYKSKTEGGTTSEITVTSSSTNATNFKKFSYYSYYLTKYDG